MDYNSINDKLNHIKKLLLNVDCECDILNLVKCTNCKSILCDNCNYCNNIQCESCKLWGCDNCVNYKTHITDPNCPNISWYVCDICVDNVNPTIKKLDYN